MAIDPVSSSGVQLGVQSALAGAVVANTLLCRPESAQIAARFFQESLRAASKRHARWAAGYYARAAARFETRFWQERAAGTALQDNPKASPIPSPVMPATALTLSPQLIFADVPCLDGEFVMLHRGLLHPALETAVVYVGGHEAAALLQGFRAGCTILELARSWTDRMPMESGLAIAAWLVNHSLLETQISVQSGVR